MTCRTCLRRLAAISDAALPRLASPARPAVRAFSSHISPSNGTSSSSLAQSQPRSLATPRASSQLYIPSRGYASIARSGKAQAATSRSRYDFQSFSTSARRPAAAAATMVQQAQDVLMPSTKPPIHVTPPSLDAIKEEGYLDDDVQLINPDEAWINITPDAVKQLERITSREPPEVLAKGVLALRVGVESGGCHGYQYTMDIVEERGVDDYVMQPEGVNCIPVVIDLVSLGLLKGATLHHATELIGSSFRLQDNPQAKQGGNCGCGISWELK